MTKGILANSIQKATSYEMFKYQTGGAKNNMVALTLNRCFHPFNFIKKV